MKKILGAAMALLLAFSAAFGAFSAERYTVRPTRVELYAGLSTMRVGQTREISYELTWPRLKYFLSQNEGLTEAELLKFATAGSTANPFVRVAVDSTEWSSDSPDIAEVNEYGEVTAHAVGTVKITLAVRGQNSAGKIVELASGDIEITVQEKRDIDDPERYMTGRETKPAAEPEKNYAGGAVSSQELTALIKDAAKSSKTAKVTVRNAAQVSADALRAAAKAATEAGAKAAINFDTMSGNSVGGRVTLDPALAAEMKGDLKLGVASTGEAVEKAAANVKNVYKNRVVIVKAEQESWGGAVRYAVKSGLNYVRARDLVLYSLNPVTGVCTAITGDAKFATDTNGYVRFTTAKGGWFVLSDGELDAWSYGAKSLS